MKGLFEINNFYKIKMDTVNSNDYMKINWAENGTTEYLVFKGTKIYWQLDKEMQFDNNTYTYYSVKYDGTLDKRDTSPSFKIISKNNKLYMKSGSNSLGYMSKITNATEEASQINSLFEPLDNDKNKDKYKINNTQISDGDFIKIITDDNKVSICYSIKMNRTQLKCIGNIL